MNPNQQHPGTPGQHVRAQRKANRLLRMGYRLQDQFGRFPTAAKFRKVSKYMRQIMRLSNKYDLKIGIIEAPAEALLAIWDGKSRGTANMIAISKARGIPVHVHFIRG